MLTLSSAITIPNLAKMRLKRPLPDDDAQVFYVQCEVSTLANLAYDGDGAGADRLYMLIVRNGVCQGIRATVSPTGFRDRVQLFSLNVPTGYTDAYAAYHNTAGGFGAKIDALETALVAAGIMPAGTVT
jgi:hypothetical protein